MARHRITIGPRASSSAVRASVRAPKAVQRFAIGPRAAKTFRASKRLSKRQSLPPKTFFNFF
jgi:hypothetical protein